MPDPTDRLIDQPLLPPEEKVDQSDRLTKELLPTLSEEKAKELALKLYADFNDALSDRTEWESRLAQDEEQYHGILPEKSFPWPGCANFHVPLTMLGVETLKPRLVESVLGEDPPILVRPVESTDDDRAARTEDFLNWQVRSEMDLPPVVEESAHLYLIPGIVVAKTTWEINERNYRAIRVFPPDTPLDTILKTVLGPDAPQETETLEKGETPEWEFTTRSTGGAKRKVRLKLHILPHEIQALIHRVETIYEGPRVHIPSPEDFIAPANGDGDVQRLPWCMHRLYYDEYDLRRKVRQGRFYQDAVEQLIGGHNPQGEDSQLDAAEVKSVRADTEGVAEQGASDVKGQQFTVLECYLRWDIDDDDVDEEVIVWITPQLPGLILGWDYLDNVYAHGRRPFRLAVYLRKPGRLYGVSFPQVVRGIQEEINTIHNFRVDAGTLQNTPMYFFPSNFTHTPDQFRLKPGEGIPVDRPQEIVPIQWAGTPVFGQNEEALLYQYFERLTGLTDLALGRQPNRVGATRTATGVTSLLSEAGLRFKTAMEAFQRFWRDIFTDILALDQQYLPPGKEFRVTGRYPEIIRLTDRQAIAGRYDIRLTPTTETMNRSILREDATVKMTAMLNPIFLMTGRIGPKGIDHLARKYLRAYGETDPGMILEPLQTQPIRTPEQEIAMWVSGIQDIKPNPAEDLDDHILKHQMVLQEKSLEGVRTALGPEGLKKLSIHLAETIQMYQLKQVAMMTMSKGGGASPVAGQQAQNAQTGKQVGNTVGAGGGVEQPAGFGKGAQNER